MNKINDVRKGDIFSEISHYTVTEVNKTSVVLTHHESKNNITLDHKYVENLLSSADQYQTEVEVTKEDGRPDKDGNVREGIRTIWENIHSSEVFCVCFQKQDTPISAKKLKEAQQAQIAAAVAEIEATAKAKKGVALKAAEVLENIQNNPILPYTPGEDRILRGYKVQFSSRDGRYDCIDMDLADDGKNSNLRAVNINTLLWLVYKGVKYVVKTK